MAHDRTCASSGRIDFHTHIVVNVPDFAQQFGDQRWPTFHLEGDVGQLIRDGRAVRSLTPAAWLPARRIEEMDAAGIDRQVISPIPPLICDWGDSSVAAHWADHINAGVAAVVNDRPNRFSGLGIVPLHHPDAAIAVLQRAHDAGLAGVEVGTEAGGREFDDPALSEFFCAAEELGMLVFIHPLILGPQPQWTDRISGMAATFGLGMTTDTAIAAMRLAFGGVTKACPNLRICLAHGGGTFFWTLSRAAHLWDATSETSSMELTRNIYADTVVYRESNLRYLRDEIGATRMVFGTDYPLPAHDDLRGPILTCLGEAEAEMVATTTAASLLGLSVR